MLGKSSPNSAVFLDPSNDFFKWGKVYVLIDSDNKYCTVETLSASKFSLVLVKKNNNNKKGQMNILKPARWIQRII